MSVNRDIEGLRHHLFAQLERIGQEDLCDQELEQEIRRGKALSDLAGTIIDSAKAEFAYMRITGGHSGTSFLPGDGVKRIKGDL